MEIKSQLNNLGFSLKEADVYLATLQLGESLITDIANTAKIKRPTTYNIIRSLIDKGAIKKINADTRTFYQAESPNKILEIFENKKKNFTKALPELNALYNLQKGVPEIKLYEGLSSIKNIYNTLLNENEEIYLIASKDLLSKKFPEIFSLHRKLSSQKKNKSINIKKDLFCIKIMFDYKEIIISLNRNISAIEINSTNIINLNKFIFNHINI